MMVASRAPSTEIAPTPSQNHSLQALGSTLMSTAQWLAAPSRISLFQLPLSSTLPLSTQLKNTLWPWTTALLRTWTSRTSSSQRHLPPWTRQTRCQTPSMASPTFSNATPRSPWTTKVPIRKATFNTPMRGAFALKSAVMLAALKWTPASPSRN